MAPQPLLAIPPFPGARPPRFAVWRPEDSVPVAADLDLLRGALVRNRVGGTYWGRQDAITQDGFLLDATGAPLKAAVIWEADHDPWALLDRAGAVRVPYDDPRAVLALAAGVATTLVDAKGRERAADAQDGERLLRLHLTGWQWHCPFGTGELSAMDAIALCGVWRRLIDANRSIGTVMGIAGWKKPTVTALLWAGAPVPYGKSPAVLAPEGAAAVWRSRITRSEGRALEEAGAAIIEIEDGFIRSAGLGADTVPPLSIIVDASGPHFDPSAPSSLEQLLQKGDFSPECIARAQSLRKAIIASGLSKYEAGGVAALPRPGGARRHVLVPGQVEDDRAVTSGGALPSNLELLRRAREEAGADAFLIYKPHPDVLAGHRKGAVPDGEVAALADAVDSTSPMAALIAMADELHVNTSLAGFEALMRDKVVTVHGVPFYAGWGLTRDRGPIPPRRTARRSIDELVAAALLIYPRYLDPATGLPCHAETLVRRLSEGAQELEPAAAARVAFRRVLGRINRVLRV